MIFEQLEGEVINNFSKIHPITSKLKCGTYGTAFFIDDRHAITAFHCIQKNITNHQEIVLEFTGENNVEEYRIAQVVDKDCNLDIALLSIDAPLTHINNWFKLCSDTLHQDDKWETLGYPEDWSDAEQATSHCYIRGNIHHIDTSNQTIYDTHLSSPDIKEDWDYTLGGLSGSPLIVKDKIVGMIIFEERSTIKNALKVVSFNKCEAFLIKNQIKVDFSFMSNDLVSKRLKIQNENCNNMFQRIETLNIDNLEIVPYYLKYDTHGKNKSKDLAAYLAKALYQYVCDLREMKELSLDPMNLLPIQQKTKKSIQKIYEQGRLGSILLWMLLEGILNVPKFFKRISLDDEKNTFFTEAYIGMRDSKLLFYIGEGKLSANFSDAVKELINILEECSDVKDDIFHSDEEIYAAIKPGHFKTKIDEFVSEDRRNWNEIIFEITIFTGYDLSIINKLESENSPSSIESLLKSAYAREVKKYSSDISKSLSNFHSTQNVKVNWIMLPFENVEDFEKLILKNFD